MRKTILAAITVLAIAFGIQAASALSGQPTLMDGGHTTPPPPPGNVACDYGPNTTFPTGALGTDLTTAGFTHCVLNADFTDNSGAHVASGGGGTNWVMNNPNTWLNQCAGTTAEWQFWFMWGDDSSGAADVGGAPCNRVSLPLDGATHALSYSYSNADTIADITHQELIFYWPDCGNFCVNTFNRSLALPSAKYYEVTFRLTSNSLNQPAGTGINLNIEDLISGNLNPGFHTAFMDPVFGEIGGNSSTSAGGTSSWDNYVSGSKFTQGGTYTLDYTNYHTYSWLQTVNGNNSTATASNSCMYLDGTAIPFGVSAGGFNENCAHWQNWTGAEILGHDMRQDVLIGTFCNKSFQTCDGNTHLPLSNPMTIFIKSIRIFTCSNYIGTNNDCGGTLVFHDITP